MLEFHDGIPVDSVAFFNILPSGGSRKFEKIIFEFRKSRTNSKQALLGIVFGVQLRQLRKIPRLTQQEESNDGIPERNSG